MSAARWCRCCGDCGRGGGGSRRRLPGLQHIGPGFDLDLIVHAGAGAYICGGEKPHCWIPLRYAAASPACVPVSGGGGLYACPTVVNNVESIASVPPILTYGVDWFKSMGTEKSPGFTLYSLSGHVTRPDSTSAIGHRAARTAGVCRWYP